MYVNRQPIVYIKAGCIAYSALTVLLKTEVVDKYFSSEIQDMRYITDTNAMLRSKLKLARVSLVWYTLFLFFV